MPLTFESIKNRTISILLDCKNKIQLAHRLDYPKKELYLCDNIRLGSCAKEPETIKWIETFEPDDIVFDVGANVGTYTLVMSLYAKHVYGIEPAYQNFYLLNKNIEYNLHKKAIKNNITPLNVALSESLGLARFNYINTHLGKAGNQLNSTVDGYHTPFVPSYSQDVLCFSIDSLIEIFKLPYPHHLKVDVDGIDFDILKGAQATLARPEFKSLMIEIDTENKEEVRAISDFLASKNIQYKDGTLIAEARFFNYLYEKVPSLQPQSS